MTLTPTQRDFLVQKLGVKPKSRARGSMEDYLRREGAVLKALTSLEGVDGASQVVAAIEDEVSKIQSRVRGAARDVAGDIYKQAYRQLDAIKERAKKEAETGEKNPTFFGKRDAVQKQLDAMNAHPQKAHVQALITEGDTRLNEAVEANGKKKYPESQQKLNAAKLALDSAKDFADKYNAYRIARVPVAGVLAKTKGVKAYEGVWGGFNGQLAQADLDATVAANKYAQAQSAMVNIKGGLGSQLQSLAQKALKKAYEGLENGPVPDFVSKEIQLIKDLHAAVPAAIIAGDWANVTVMQTRGQRIAQNGTDRATRRKAYLDERKNAVDAIASLKGNTAMAKQVEAFEKVLTEQADPFATSEAQRFEEAIALCVKVVADCKALAGTAAASKKFGDDRKALDQRLKTLQSLPAAAQMTEAMKSLAVLLAEADKCVLPEKLDWAGGQQWLDRLAADLATAEGLAKSLDAALGAQAAVQKAGKADDLTAVGASLRQEADKLDADPFKALLATPLKDLRAAVTEALKKAGDGKLEEARTQLATAAELLAKAQNLKSLQQGFEPGLKGAQESQQRLVDQAKTGSFTAMQPKVDLIQPQIDQAKEGAKHQDFAAASAALGRAAQAIKVAEDAAAGIKEVDDKAAPLKDRAGDMKKAGTDVTEVEGVLAQASTAMGQLKLAEALKLLAQAQAELEALKIKGLTETNPNDPNIAATAEQLLKLGGGAKMLDDFVSTLNNENQSALIIQLAEKRFGIKLEFGGADKTVSAKEMWKVMAELPPSHATKNPSLTTAIHTGPGANANSISGSHNIFSKTVKISGRPDVAKQEKFDKATREKALGIPQDHDNAADPYAPVDLKGGDLFNFTMLHEVGHAVDDRLGFMASHAGEAAFGGWVQYSDLTPIATAVADEKGYDAAYVRQLLNGNKPEPAPMPANYAGDAAKWERARQNVHTWHTAVTQGSIWGSYAASKDAAINGVVYQESYGGRWASYLLAERAKGVTAYQWRAPGEWFAELYMCWYGKKLKPEHPFADWLSKL